MGWRGEVTRLESEKHDSHRRAVERDSSGGRMAWQLRRSARYDDHKLVRTMMDRPLREGMGLIVGP